MLVATDYESGGHDYKTNSYVRRGYYLSARAVTSLDDSTVSSVPEDGYSVLLKEVSRESKWARKSARERITPALVESLVNQLPHYQENIPEQQTFDFESI